LLVYILPDLKNQIVFCFALVLNSRKKLNTI
jgi:hypothetical protein